jgi:diguanylate cyclase (GGDEF)-like protein
VASTVLAGAALYGWQLYRVSQNNQEIHVQAITEAYAAQLAPSTLTGRIDEVQDFLDQLVLHDNVVLLSVVNADNRQLAIRGSDSLLDRMIGDLEKMPTAGEPIRWRLSGDPDRMVPELVLASVPVIPSGARVAIGRVHCAARTPGPATASIQDVWAFFSALLLIASTGMTLGVLWFKKSTVWPLRELARRSAARIAESISDERDDEIGEVARVMAELRQSLEDSRQRMTHLESTMRDQVSAETSSIMRQLQRVERKSWTDPLTRLGNRRLFDDKFEEIFLAQQNAGLDLSVVMLDVDYFKTLNDTLGHKAGDDLLTFAGELLKQCLRDDDLAIRLGGDEFLLVLPSASATDAHRVAQRTILMFAQQSRLLEVDPKPTMSGGVASLTQHHPATPQALLELADEALYKAKRAGKGQVAVYSGRQVPALV